MTDFSKTLRSLFPTGQVFRFFSGTQFRLFIDALAQEPERIIMHADEIRDAGIPGYIPSDALSDWESFLNLNPDSALTDVQRQQRITGKIATIGGQGKDYLQDVLQSAGFPVYVFENIPSTEPSARVYTAALGNFQLGETDLGDYSNRIDPRSLLGTLIYGAPVWDTLKNYTCALGNFQLDDTDCQLSEYNGTETIEVEYTIPADSSRFIFVWFICDQSGVNHFVDIPIERKDDFKKLVNAIKPVHTWALAQINWV